MRSDPRSSPEAPTRVLALLLIADGNVCRSEIQARESLGAPAALGLARDGLAPIAQADRHLADAERRLIDDLHSRAGGSTGRPMSSSPEPSQ